MKNPKLKLLYLTIGDDTNTKVSLIYLEGIAEPSLIEEVTRRLAGIRIDGIHGSENLEEWISDQPWSPFPQMLSTERPDVVCANLLEGRFALITDGTPFAIIAPINVFSLLQSAEDYYQHLSSAASSDGFAMSPFCCPCCFRRRMWR